jgi:iron complex outermembrane recepter protein
MQEFVLEYVADPPQIYFLENALATSRRISTLLVPATALLLGSATAIAADSPSDLEEVTVTAIRQPFRGDTPLNELPQSVQVLDEQMLKDIGATQLDTALDLVSGIARQNTFGGLWDSFAIRGFAGDENVPSGYLVNGFNAGRGFSGRRDASNVQSIEVLKGPGSALYGRSEPGGTINLVTKKPQFDPEGSLELSGGKFNTYRIAGDYTGALGSSNRVAFRINGAYQKADSFRDFFSSKKATITPSILFKLTDSTALNYEFEWVKQEAPFDRGVVAVNGELGLIPRSQFLGSPADGDIKIDATGHQLSLQHQINSNWSFLAGANYRDSNFKGFSSEAELVNGRQRLFTAPALGLLSRQRRSRDYGATDLSGRAELSGKIEGGAVTHHILFGADIYDFESDQVQLRYRPLATNLVYAINIYNLNYNLTPGPLIPITTTLEKQDAFGVYLQDQIDLTAQWKLLGGIRFDDFKQTITNSSTGVLISRQSKTATSPRVGLVYTASHLASVYASYSKGFRPNSGASFAGVGFEPEISRSYEIGAKLESADKRTNAIIALYKGKKSNILTADPVNAGASIPAGAAESKGLEFDLSSKPTDSLRLNLAYAYTDAQTRNAYRDSNFSFAIPKGSPLVNIPKHSANALLVHDLQVGEAEANVGASLTYVGKRLGETGFSPSFILPSYTLFNVLGSYSPTEQLKFSAHVNNVFNKDYYPSSYSRFWVAPGAPRSYTIAAEFKF